MWRLTFGGGYGLPVWTADGRYLVFTSAQGMFWARADGTGKEQPLTQSNHWQRPWSFTTDGRLAFVEINPAIQTHGYPSRAEIWTVPVKSDGLGLRAGKPEVFLQAPFNARSPMFSPDGHWIAYQSDEAGDVYVQAFPNKHDPQKISPNGGAYPSWSRNGHELFFLQVGQPVQLMVVPYQVRGDSFVAGKPRLWSERSVGFSTSAALASNSSGPAFEPGGRWVPYWLGPEARAARSYDPASDGKHVVALMPAETSQESQDQMIILLNFFDELRRRVPFNAN
jgi:serine/threonine-protein kinase